MATTAYHNQFMRCAQFFFYVVALVIVVHNSHIGLLLMEMFESNDILQLA